MDAVAPQGTGWNPTLLTSNQVAVLVRRLKIRRSEDRPSGCAKVVEVLSLDTLTYAGKGPDLLSRAFRFSAVLLQYV